MLLTSSGWEITSFLVNLAFTQLEIDLRVKGAGENICFMSGLVLKGLKK